MTRIGGEDDTCIHCNFFRTANFWGQGNILQFFSFSWFHISSSREKKSIQIHSFGVDLRESPTWEIEFCISYNMYRTVGKDEDTSGQAWYRCLVEMPFLLQ